MAALTSKRGRKVGTFDPGSLGGWLSRAKPGESFWTEQSQRTADTTARRAGREVETRAFYALHPVTLEVVKLTRVRLR